MRLNQETLHQLGGLTGIGWTAAVIGYLSTLVGFGGQYVARLVTDPHSLLYAGVVLFLATFGLDKLANTETRDHTEKPTREA